MRIRTFQKIKRMNLNNRSGCQTFVQHKGLSKVAAIGIADAQDQREIVALEIVDCSIQLASMHCKLAGVGSANNRVQG